MKQRYDKALIQDYIETPEGYLTVTAPITRPGVFPYRHNDGIVMEAKLPEDLFSAKTVSSANAKPVTDDHPSELVTSANHKEYAKGMTHTNAVVRDHKLYISFTVTDADTINKIKNGKRELSIGFLADIEKATGDYEGTKYDAIQRNMQINHVAIVDKGRAGPTVSIRGDSAFMVDGEQKNKGGQNMPTIKFDGVDYEVDAVVKAKVEALQAKVDAAEIKVKEIDALQGKYDALETKLAEKEAELAKAKQKTDGLDEAVNARVELIGKTKSILGDTYDFTGKTDREIKEDIILVSKKDFKADGKSDDYINAFYDAITAEVKERGFTNSVMFRDSGSKSEVEKMKNQRLNMKGAK